MEINAGSIEVALFPPVATERVIHTTIQLNPEAPYHEKSVQEAFYANPFLLSDFKAVDVLFGCDSAMFVPSAVTAQAGVEAVYSAGGGETGAKRFLTALCPETWFWSMRWMQGCMDLSGAHFSMSGWRTVLHRLCQGR